MTLVNGKRGMDGQIVGEGGQAMFAVDARPLEAILVLVSRGQRRTTVSVRVTPAELAIFAAKILARCEQLGFKVPHLVAEAADTPETVEAKANAAGAALRRFVELCAPGRKP